MKKNKGITLVALIITIIVMLILVAVSVRIAIRSGLLDAAGKSTQTWTKEAEAEGNLSGIKIGDKDLDDYMSTIDKEEVKIPWIYETKSDGTIKITDFDYSKLTAIEERALYVKGKYLLGTDTLIFPSKIDGKIVSEIAFCAGEVPHVFFLWSDVQDVNKIIFSEGIKEISGSFVFSKLESLVIPASINNKSYSDFPKSDYLKSIVVDKNNKIIDSRNNCNAIIVTSTNELIMGTSNTVIPESVTKIGVNAFAGLVELQSIVIPKGITTIGDSAFDRCNALTTVYYKGSKEEWQKITIEVNNDSLKNANIIYNYVQE